MKRCIIIFIVFLVFVNIFGQDPTFSQFYANKLYLAPSFVGAVEDYRFTVNYRNQWPGISHIYNTYSVSFDKSLPNFNSGIGFLATYDIAGSGNLSTTNIGVLYSYDVKLNNKWRIRPGINFKFYYLGLDINKLIFNSGVNNNIPPVNPPIFNNIADIDLTASVITYNDRIWGGVTFDHILTPKTSFYEGRTTLPIKFNAFGGIQLIKQERLINKKPDIVSIATNFQTQGKFYQTDIGVYYLRSPLLFGLWYRGIPLISNQVGDAVIGLIGIKTKNIFIGYSYDITISSLNKSTNGAHEVSFIYEFNSFNIQGKQRMRALPCPEF